MQGSALQFATRCKASWELGLHRGEITGEIVSSRQDTNMRQWGEDSDKARRESFLGLLIATMCPRMEPTSPKQQRPGWRL